MQRKEIGVDREIADDIGDFKHPEKPERFFEHQKARREHKKHQAI